MFGFGKRKHSQHTTCILPLTEGYAFSRISAPGPGTPQLLAAGCGEAGLAMPQARDRGNTHILLPVGDYQLLMVEAPEVPPDELRAAVRWRIRDLIDFHIDDAVLDVFDVPPSGARRVQESLYVVVAHNARVRERLDPFEQAGIDIDVIDIPELAMRNLAARLPADTDGVALLFFAADYGLMTLTRAGMLYLARSLDFGHQQIARDPALEERLALELQRSLDYYDRHFLQAPVSRIALCPLPGEIRELGARLAELTGLAVENLAPAALLQTETDKLPAPEDCAEWLLSLGGALRSETRVL